MKRDSFLQILIEKFTDIYFILNLFLTCLVYITIFVLGIEVGIQL